MNSLERDHEAAGSSRREFLRQMATWTVLALQPGASGSPSDSRRLEPIKAAVIGHTGHGNYGHGLDVIFNDRPGIEVVALADEDAAGREKASLRCGAKRTYADYRELLRNRRHPLAS